MTSKTTKNEKCQSRISAVKTKSESDMAERGRGEMVPLRCLHIVHLCLPCDQKNPLNHLSAFTGIFKPLSLLRLILCNSPIDQTVSIRPRNGMKK